MLKKLSAEAFGTFWLVFGGCGSAVLAAGFPDLGIGFVGVALAFGLTVLTMAYAVGRISGGHFNPAVSLGLAIGGRFAVQRTHSLLDRAGRRRRRRRGDPLHHRLGQAGWMPGGFASNGYGALSPGGYSLLACLVIEVVLTGGLPHRHPRRDRAGAPAGFAPHRRSASCLTLIHLISIPVTNTSVNPARSTAVAFFAETGAVGQLWLFWVAPLVGAAHRRDHLEVAARSRGLIEKASRT